MNGLKIFATISLCWSAIGFVVGVVDSSFEREGSVRFEKGEAIPYDVHTGCVYKSYASFINPGYVLGCELYRKRFEKEGFKK